MARFLFSRILQLIPTLFVVAVIVFFVTRLLPGNPAAVMLGPQASVEDVEKYTEELGLNEPVITQFFNYIWDLITLNFGNSLSYNAPIIDLILERFPNTIILAISALILAIIVGIPVGILAARKQNTFLDYLITTFSLVGVSMPIFWLGVMLVLLFSVNLGLFPATGMGDITEDPIDFFKHLVLPTIALATIPMAEFARIVRSSMIEVLKNDYVKAAKAKGGGRGPCSCAAQLLRPMQQLCDRIFIRLF